MDEIFKKLMGIGSGSVKLSEVPDVLRDDKIKNKQFSIAGDYNIPWVNTKTQGGTDSWETLQKWFEQAQASKMNDIHSTPTQQELDYGISPAGITPQAPPERQVLGAGAQTTNPYGSLPQLEGRTPVQDIMVPDEVVEAFVRNAKKWASTTQPNASKYPYRQPDTVGENAEYVASYVDAIMRLAPYFNLPPKTMVAMLMEESGWGGQRFDGNLGGYGFLDSGEDMGIRFGAPTVEEQAAKYLERVSSDWGGRYQGSRTPQDFHKKGYNPHASYPGRVMDVYRMLEAGL